MKRGQLFEKSESVKHGEIFGFDYPKITSDHQNHASSDESQNVYLARFGKRFSFGGAFCFVCVSRHTFLL